MRFLLDPIPRAEAVQLTAQLAKVMPDRTPASMGSYRDVVFLAVWAVGRESGPNDPVDEDAQEIVDGLRESISLERVGLSRDALDRARDVRQTVSRLARKMDALDLQAGGEGSAVRGQQ